MKPQTLLAYVQAYDKLIGTKYIIHLGRGGKHAIFSVTIEKEDCHHLMGIHYLRDIEDRSNRSKIFDRLMSEPHYRERLASSTQWTDELENCVACTTVLEQILDDNNTIYRYNPKRLYFYSQITAEYLLAQSNYQITPVYASDIYLFIDKCDDSETSNRFCKSIFPKRGHDFTEYQAKWTLLYSMYCGKLDESIEYFTDAKNMFDDLGLRDEAMKNQEYIDLVQQAIDGDAIPGGFSLEHFSPE